MKAGALLRCVLIGAAFAPIGVAISMKTWEPSPERTLPTLGRASGADPHPDALTGQVEADTRDPCLEDRQTLSRARDELEARRLEFSRLQAVGGNVAASASPAPDGVIARSQALEARLRALVEGQELAGLSIDCDEQPCLVFGSGKRGVIEPLAEAISADPAFAALRPVVVSRVVVDTERHPDTVSALALMSQNDYDDVDERTEFESMLRTRIGRLQE